MRRRRPKAYVCLSCLRESPTPEAHISHAKAEDHRRFPHVVAESWRSPAQLATRRLKRAASAAGRPLRVFARTEASFDVAEAVGWLRRKGLSS